MATEDDILDQLKLLNRNFTRATGGGTPWGAGPGTSSVGSTAGVHKTTNSALGGLRKASDKLTQSMRVLDGSTAHLHDTFTELLRLSVIGGALAGAFHYAIESVTKLVGTYNKLADVGQLFQGSLIEMQRQAADAGLSLEEYSQLIQKHSVLAAVMNQQQDATKQSLNALQKAVRDTLKPMGFYGMSLNQVNDITLDIAENFRQSGWLYRTTADDQKKAVSSFAEELTALALASGKSRQKIMEDANRAMRDTGALAALALSGNAKSTEALTKWSATLASMGDMGPEMSKALNETIVMGGASFSQLGQTMIKLGASDVVGMMDDLARKIKAGYVPTIDEQLQLAQAMSTAVQNHTRDWQALAPRNADAMRLLAWAGQLRDTYNLDAIKKQLEDQRKEQNALTQAALTFESTFHQLTAEFRMGLYEQIISAFVPKPDDKKAYDDFINDLKTNLHSLGVAFGELIVAVIPLIPVVVDIVKWLAHAAETVRDFFKGTGMSTGWADLFTVLGAFLAKKLLGLLLRTIFAPIVRIRTASTIISGGGSLGDILENVLGKGKVGGLGVMGTAVAGATTAAAVAALAATALEDHKLKGTMDEQAKEKGFEKQGGSLWNPFNKMPTYYNPETKERLSYAQMQERLRYDPKVGMTPFAKDYGRKEQPAQPPEEQKPPTTTPPATPPQSPTATAPVNPPNPTAPNLQTVPKNIEDNQARLDEQITNDTVKDFSQSIPILQNIGDLLDKIRKQLEDQTGLLKLNNDSLVDLNRRGTPAYLQ